MDYKTGLNIMRKHKFTLKDKILALLLFPLAWLQWCSFGRKNNISFIKSTKDFYSMLLKGVFDTNN